MKKVVLCLISGIFLLINGVAQEVPRADDEQGIESKPLIAQGEMELGGRTNAYYLGRGDGIGWLAYKTDGNTSCAELKQVQIVDNFENGNKSLKLKPESDDYKSGVNDGSDHKFVWPKME